MKYYWFIISRNFMNDDSSYRVANVTYNEENIALANFPCICDTELIVLVKYNKEEATLVDVYNSRGLVEVFSPRVLKVLECMEEGMTKAEALEEARKLLSSDFFK